MLTEPIKCHVCGAVSVNGGWIACCGCYAEVAIATRKEVAEWMGQSCVEHPLNAVFRYRYQCLTCVRILLMELLNGEIPKEK